MWSPVSVFVLVKIAVVELVAWIFVVECHFEVFVRCLKVSSRAS